MEHLANILSALKDNSFAFTIVLILIGLIIYGVKKGALSFHSNNLELGTQNRERVILQRQTTYIHSQIDAISNILLKQHSDFDMYHTFWICKCVEIEWIRAIHYNHIEYSEGYLSDRFTQIKAIVQKKASHSYFFTKEFDEFLEQHVDSTVKALERIRKNG